MRAGARYLAFLGVAAGLFGCAPALTPGPKPPADPERPALGASEDLMQANGVDLRMIDASPSGGETRKPTFWLHADVFSLAEADVWTFEKARAVIYGREPDAPEIRMEAGRGRFQEAKLASLQGGVEAQIGVMRLSLEDLEWFNEERVARSDSPVAIAVDSSRIQAGTVRLYPDRKELVLTNVTGVVDIGAEGGNP